MSLMILCWLAASLLGAGAQEGFNVDNKRAPIRVAVCQVFCIDGDAEGNLRRVEHALEQAARQGAALACFPESVILGWINPEAHQLAEPIPGPITERLGHWARRHKLMICIGMGGMGALGVIVTALLWCALSYSLFVTALLTLMTCVWLLVAVNMGLLPLLETHDDAARTLALRLGVILFAIGPLLAASIAQARSRYRQAPASDA